MKKNRFAWLVWTGVAALAAVCLPAGARSITDVSLDNVGGAITLTATFEAGETGDEHALYVAYASEDKGTALADWTTFQRVGKVAAGATSATATLLPSLVDAGYTVCRVFLVESVYPFDTLVESVRQSGTQYVETGIVPGPTTFVSLDFCIDSNATRQQRIFGVASDDGTSLFSFDAYINGSGYWASACRDGNGNWTATDWVALPVRTTVSLDAASGLHFLSNHVSHAVTSKSHANTSRTLDAAGPLTLFARRTFANGEGTVGYIVTGGNIYSCVISNEGALVRSYLPCTLNGRAGLYDGVSGSIAWSAVAGDDFTAEGGNLPCAPAAGETAVSVSDANDIDTQLTGTIWTGAASGNWNAVDANWSLGGVAQAWSDGADAVFADQAATFDVVIPAGTTVTPASVKFVNARDYTLGGEGCIAGAGTFTKQRTGRLVISGVDNSFTGDVLLAGGETVLAGDKDANNITSGALGNPRVARTIAVSNATLRVTGKNPFVGSGRSSTPVRAVLKLYNSVLDLPEDFTFNVGDLYLHDSSVNIHYGFAAQTHWGSLFAENIYFSGSSPIIFTVSNEKALADQKNAGLLLGKFAQATLDVPDITCNSASDVIFRIPVFSAGGNGTDPGVASGFRKTGAGTLELGARDNDIGIFLSNFTGDVDVVEGTLSITRGMPNYPLNRVSSFGLANAPHTVTVHPGATLYLGQSDLMGQFYATNFITIHVNGGTLSQDANRVNGLGRLILENATFTYKGAYVQTNNSRVSDDLTTTNVVPVNWPTFGFNGGVEFLGTNVYTLANGDNNGTHARFFFGTADGNPTDCYVAEISGRGTADDTSDVTVNARLEDAPPWYSINGTRIITGFNYGLRGSTLNMRKTGPGILQLNSKLSTTTGRIEVVEGTLKMGTGMNSGEANFECPTNTLLGDLRDPNRTALVLNGGTFWLAGNDTLGQANTVNGSTFAVTNGTIRQTAGVVNAMPVLDLYDAAFDYRVANTGSNGDTTSAQPWGTFIFAQRVRFDGTRPYDLQNVGGTCYFSLGWQSDSYQAPSTYKNGAIDQHGKTEFYVADITQDANPDVTIGVVLKYPCHWNGNSLNSKYANFYFRTGLLKTGPGTLRLNCGTAAEKYYAEATRVNGGTLLVDAATFNSTNVFVQAGAHLGGTGTVARATIEAGGGFTAAPGQARALTLQAAELPADGVVTLDVPYAGDVERLESVRVPVVTASALAGATWRVTLNGAAVPHGYVGSVSVRDGVVYGVVGRGGTSVIIR